MKITKNALMFLLLSLVMLASSVFAWINVSRVSNTDSIDGNIADFADLVSFEVKRSGDEDFIRIEEIKDMLKTFGDTKPGETYTFRFEIKNPTNNDREMIVEIKNIFTNYKSEETEDYDLRDVFYIIDGQVDIVFYDLYDGSLIGTPEPFILPVISEDPVVKHGQTLNPFRLNNLINQSTRNLIIAPIIPVEIGTRAVITFTLVYDDVTESIFYQENELRFSGIYIYGQ